jgi:serine/threonine protein kinase
MCTFSYNSVAEIITGGDIFGIMTRNHKSKPILEIDKDSQSSSFDLSWLGPFPESDEGRNRSIPLPTYEDFEYIGRLGDGASAKVYCVEHIPSKQYVAIKVADGTNEQARQQLEVERQILFRHSHGNPYMIQAYCAFHRGV